MRFMTVALVLAAIAGPAVAQEKSLSSFSQPERQRLGPQADGRATAGPSSWQMFKPRQCWNYYWAAIDDYVTEMLTWEGRTFSKSNFDQPGRTAFNNACLSGATIGIEVFTYSDGVPGWRSFLVLPKE